MEINQLIFKSTTILNSNSYMVYRDNKFENLYYRIYKKDDIYEGMLNMK